MENLTTPGVYFEPLQPTRVTGDLLRSDIAAFIGYAQQGPVTLPVRVESWRQFLTIFGLPMEPGHLALAVKAFFENGGTTCYVLRIVDQHAREASHQLKANNSEELWKTYASFRISDIATTEAVESVRPDAAVIQNISPDFVREPLPNPGAWGNSLSVSVQRNSRLSTQTNDIFNDGFSTRVDSLVGLEQYSIVELSQEQQQTDGKKIRITRIIAIESIDRIRQTVIWQESLLQGSQAFKDDVPVRLDTVEFDISIYFDNRQVEKFPWLGLHPQHSRNLYQVLAEQSQFINFVFLGKADTDWHATEFWPKNIEQAVLSDGTDGVSEIAAVHYHAALAVVAKVDEVSVVAAPDLVLFSPELNLPVSELIPQEVDCHSLTPPSLGVIYGEVTDGVNALANVTITDAESGQRTITDKNGLFQLLNLDISLRTLRFEKSGFSNEELQVFSLISIPDKRSSFSLQPLAIARSLSELEILDVQRAMANPALLGRYRVALLDPPQDKLKIEEIRSWRTKVGDSAFAGLFYPWIETTSPLQTDNGLFRVPPCGHVAGLMARMDVEKGPHRAPANIRLRFARGVAQSVSDTQQGIFNPEGINAIRSLPGQGIRVYGARTLSSDAQWRYLSVRRLVLALEKTLEHSLQWAVFESNTTVLRQAVVLSIRTLLNTLWRGGALAGNTADAAFRIKCDSDNNPPEQRDQGKLLAEIGIAPTVPFEFIRIRFGKTLDAIEVTE